MSYEKTNQLCRNPDAPGVFERPHWIADLNNGETIYQDNDNEKTPCSIILKEYLVQNKLRVNNIRLRFRTHIVSPLPQGMSVYYLSKSAGAWFGEPTKEFYNIGFMDEHGYVHKLKYCIPELELMETSKDKIEDCIPEFVINNDNP